MDAIELVGQACLLTSNPMEHGAIELPYDPHAGFAIETLGRYTVYVFGANATSPENRLVVSTDIVDKLVAEQGRLFVRNRIYRQVFGEEWVRRNMPDAGEDRDEDRRAPKEARNARPIGHQAACLGVLYDREHRR